MMKQHGPLQMISELKKWIQVKLMNITCFSPVLVPVTHVMWKKMPWCDVSDVDALAPLASLGRAWAFV